jgi:adenylate cyclase class 2
MTDNANNLEIEVKFLIGDIAAFRDRLLAAGGIPTKPRVYERNVRFDTAGESLRQRDELLRLRQDAAVRLTFKGPALHTKTSEAKVREEIEVEVADFEKTAAIIERLGLQACQVYEKYRETLRWQNVEVVLDEMPFGNFVELEGEVNSIKEAAVALGLDWSRRILDNYLALMERLKDHHHLPFNDVTFRNFQDCPVSIAAIL